MTDLTMLDAIIVGAVQGLTEFLPVSSSGHLVFVKYFYGVHGVTASYILLLHLGTLVAIVAALWKDVVRIARETITGEGYGRPVFLAVVVATIPGGLFGYFLADKVDSLFLTKGITLGKIPISPYQLVGVAFIITASVFIKQADEVIKKREKEKTDGFGPEKMDWLTAVKIGIAQAIAIVPGISRSGATIATGLKCGLSREFAARFSFLMSIPIILGAVLSDYKELNLTFNYPPPEFHAMIVGVLVAMVTGYLAIRYMINLLVTGDLHKFGTYLWIVGLICVAS